MGLLSSIKSGLSHFGHKVAAEIIEETPAIVKRAVDATAFVMATPSAIANLINPDIVPRLDHALQTVKIPLKPTIVAATDALLIPAFLNRPPLSKTDAGVSPARTGNQITTLVDGVAYKTALIDQINDPNNKSIWIQAYEWQDSSSANDVADALIAVKTKAKAEGRDLDVRVLFDNRASSGELVQKTSRSLKEPPKMDDMRAAGIDVRRTDYAGMRVNHRKISVFNGEKAFIGGQNIGNNYMLDASWTYHDVTQIISGPSASDAAKVFADSWYRAGGAKLALLPPAPAQTGAGIGAKVQVISHSGGMDRNIQSELIDQIGKEKSEVILMNGFGMSDAIARALKSASARGVKVTWIWGEAAHLPSLMAQIKFDELRSAGVEIRHYPTPLHIKAAYFRGNDAIMQGSSNLDGFSTFLNDEVVVQITGGGVPAEFYSQVIAPDLAKSPVLTTSTVVAPKSTLEDVKTKTAERVIDGD